MKLILFSSERCICCQCIVFCTLIIYFFCLEGNFILYFCIIRLFSLCMSHTNKILTTILNFKQFTEDIAKRHDGKTFSQFFAQEKHIPYFLLQQNKPKTSCPSKKTHHASLETRRNNNI